MRLAFMTAGALLLAGLSACDAVNYPGRDTRETADEPAPVAPEAEETTNQVDAEPDVVAEPDAPDEDGTPPPTDAETEVEPASEALDETAPQPAAGPDAGEPAPAATPQAAEELPPVERGGVIQFGEVVMLPPEDGAPGLAAINAAICVQPGDAEPTLTLAERLGTQPAAGEPDPDALGDMAAELGMFPGLVKMEPRVIDMDGRTLTGHCNAVRVAERWFVTAAHCVDDGHEDIRLIAGADNLQNAAEARIVSADLALCHGAYERRGEVGYVNDIALLRVPGSAVEALTTLPLTNLAETRAPLSPANYPTGEVAGWGLAAPGGTSSSLLLRAPVRLEAIGPAEIVAAGQEGTGPCVGDSGGPLYVTESDGKKVLVGLLSGIEPSEADEFCTGNDRARYTNLQGFAAWTAGVIEACTADPDLCQLPEPVAEPAAGEETQEATHAQTVDGVEAAPE